MFYGIEMNKPLWWDLFCSRHCFDMWHPHEMPERFTIKSFLEQEKADVTNKECCHCGHKLGCELTVNYSDEPVYEGKRPSVFLAGPTPRSIEVPSWRPDAIQYFRHYYEFNGVVFVPEHKDHSPMSSYDNQVEWEWAALHQATYIVFWVPRNLANMPALTTNVEFGYYLAKMPEKIIYGRPVESEKNRYLDWLYSKHSKLEIYTKLKDVIGKAVSLL